MWRARPFTTYDAIRGRAALLVGVNVQARRDNSLQSHVINCDSINSRCLHNDFNYCRVWQSEINAPI